MISDLAARLRPYVPGEQPREEGLIRLNTNESAREPSPHVAEAIRSMLNDGGGLLRRYPDPTALNLREALGTIHGLDAEQIFVGNGSDEVLAFIFAAFFAGASDVRLPDITYGFYDSLASLYDVHMQRQALSSDFSIEVDDYLNVGGGVIFPNPNAPTGRTLPLEAIKAIVAASPKKIIVIDEAYGDFSGQSAIPLIADHENLIVVQTFSKSRALAGLRVGMAFSAPQQIMKLENAKNCFNSYPLGALAQIGAIAALEDSDWLEVHVRSVQEQRNYLTDSLSSMGFEVIPSSANFVMARHPAVKGRLLYEGLRARRILVRHFNQSRISDYLRITIGEPLENAALLDALHQIVKDLA